jgi:membrane-associated phospholipid phosphatase
MAVRQNALKLMIIAGILVLLLMPGSSLAGSADLGLSRAGLPDRGGRQPLQLGLDPGYLKGYIADTGSIATGLPSWSMSAWLKIPVIAGVTTVLADDEDNIQRWLQNRRSLDSNRVAAFAKVFGDGKCVVPALAALYCAGRVLDGERARRTALLGMESLAITGLFTEALKYATQKHRPVSGDLEDVSWDGPGLSGANLSFPSGHAAAAFAVATVAASVYSDNPIVPPLAYGTAALCAYSRLNDNAHWMSDVLVGSAIGYFTAKAVVGLHGGETRARHRFGVAPVVNSDLAGLSVSYGF